MEEKTTATERGHHPFSPSKLEVLELCPGRWKLCKDIPDHAGQAAIEGEMLHAHVESASIDGLTSEQAECVEACLFYLEDPKAWVMDDDTFDVLTSGYIDAYKVDGNKARVVDWKFGRSAVTDAEKNLQIKTYGSMVIEKTGVDECELAVFQPRLKQISKAIVLKEEVAGIKNRIKAIINECKSDGLRLCPSSKACSFCLAKGICSAYKMENSLITEELVKLSGTHGIVNPSELSVWLEKWRAVKKVGASLEHHVKQMLLEGNAVPGWKLKNKAGARTVSDAEGLYNAVKDILSHDDFMKCVSVKAGDVEDVYSRKLKETQGTPITSNKQAFKNISAPFISRAPDSVSLVSTNEEED
jgi:hypothetical protein